MALTEGNRDECLLRYRETTSLFLLGLMIRILYVYDVVVGTDVLGRDTAAPGLERTWTLSSHRVLTVEFVKQPAMAYSRQELAVKAATVETH
jgi:hypothetical protein